MDGDVEAKKVWRCGATPSPYDGVAKCQAYAVAKSRRLSRATPRDEVWQRYGGGVAGMAVVHSRLRHGGVHTDATPPRPR
jgi:hypothetical protein